MDAQRPRLGSPPRVRGVLSRKLVVLHIDGLSAGALRRAIDDRRMPFVRQLLDSEGYEIHPYRCGIPSTTPFAQAGTLYSANSEVPSLRWRDHDRRVLAQCAAGLTMKNVTSKSFQMSHAL